MEKKLYEKRLYRRKNYIEDYIERDYTKKGLYYTKEKFHGEEIT